MLKIVTLKTGNTSWWKNIKYRREAAADLILKNIENQA
jgi:hypothetical protein